PGREEPTGAVVRMAQAHGQNETLAATGKCRFAASFRSGSGAPLAAAESEARQPAAVIFVSGKPLLKGAVPGVNRRLTVPLIFAWHKEPLDKEATGDYGYNQWLVTI